MIQRRKFIQQTRQTSLELQARGIQKSEVSRACSCGRTKAHHGRYRVEAERLVCLAAASWSYDGSSRAQPRRLKNGTRGHCRRAKFESRSPRIWEQ